MTAFKHILIKRHIIYIIGKFGMDLEYGGKGEKDEGDGWI